MIEALQKLWLFGGPVVGASIVFMLDASRREAEMARQFWAALTVAGIALVGAWFLADVLGHEPPFFYLFSLLGGAAAGVAAGVFFLRKLPHLMEKFSLSFTKKTTVERNKKTDVREIAKHLPPQLKHYDPRKFFDKKKGVFVGLDVEKKPIFIQKKPFLWPLM